MYCILKLDRNVTKSHKDTVTKLSQSYAQKSFIFLVLSLSAAALNYLYYPIIAHFLSPSSFGATQVLIAIVMQVGAIFAGLNLVTIYLVHHFGAETSRGTIETLQKCTTTLFIIASILLLFFASEVSSFLNIGHAWYLLIVSIDLLTSIPFIIAFGYLQAQKRFMAAGLLQNNTVLLKLIAGAIGTIQFGVSGALAGLAFGQIAGMGSYWLLCHLSGLKPWDHAVLTSLRPPSVAEIRRLTPVAGSIAAIFGVNVMLALFISFDLIAARHYFPPAVSGLYAGASTLSNAIVFVCLPLIGVLLPHLDRNNLAAESRYLFRTSAAVITIICASVVVFYFIPEFLLRFFGTSYVAMAPLLWRLGILMGLVSLLTLAVQVNALYMPKTALLICLLCISGSILGVSFHHITLLGFVSIITYTFGTIVVLAILQTTRIYLYGTKKTR